MQLFVRGISRQGCSYLDVSQKDDSTSSGRCRPMHAMPMLPRETLAVGAEPAWETREGEGGRKAGRM